MDWVYTPDGLVLGYGLTPSRRQVNIDVYQVLLGGKKPLQLRGAKPDAITVVGNLVRCADDEAVNLEGIPPHRIEDDPAYRY